MDLCKISDSEMLYRVVRKSFPDGFINGAPTAALFIDAAGASVERDGGRCEQDIICQFIKRFGRRDDYATAVKLSAADCRSVDTYPNPIGNHKNKFHAEIWDSDKTREISLLKAIKLAKLCQVVNG